MSITEILGIVSIVAYVLSGLLFITAIILFFKLRVPAILDDLSGRKAERQIREMREQNRQVLSSNNRGRMIYESAAGRGAVTGKVAATGKTVTTEKSTSRLNFGKKKEVEEGTSLLEQEEGTSLLGEEGTTLLGEEGTTLLGEEGTTLLGEEGTTLLGSNEMNLPNGYRIVIDAMVIHTEERI